MVNLKHVSRYEGRNILDVLSVLILISKSDILCCNDTLLTSGPFCEDKPPLYLDQGLPPLDQWSNSSALSHHDGYLLLCSHHLHQDLHV